MEVFEPFVAVALESEGVGRVDVLAHGSAVQPFFQQQRPTLPPRRLDGKQDPESPAELGKRGSAEAETFRSL